MSDATTLKFQRAVSYIQSLPSSRAGPSSATRLRLYSLYKVATVGPCNVTAPGPWKVTARAKWEAWNGLGEMDKDDAQKQYVEEIIAIVLADPMDDMSKEMVEKRSDFLKQMQSPDLRPATPPLDSVPMDISLEQSVPDTENVVGSSSGGSHIKPDSNSPKRDEETVAKLHALRELQSANLQRLKSLEMFLGGSVPEADDNEKLVKDLIERIQKLEAQVHSTHVELGYRIQKIEQATKVTNNPDLALVRSVGELLIGAGIFGMFMLQMHRMFFRTSTR